MISSIVLAFLMGLFGACAEPFEEIGSSSSPAIELVLAADAVQLSQEELEQSVTILEQRLSNLLIDVSVESNTVALTLPALDEAALQRAIRLATQQGNLSFHLVKETSQNVADLSPADLEDDAFQESVIGQAQPGEDQFGQNILFDVHSDYQDAFEALTRENLGRRLAVVYDGNILLAPTIQGVIRDSGQITGNRIEKDEELVRILNSGPLQATFLLVEIRTITD